MFNRLSDHESNALSNRPHAPEGKWVLWGSGVIRPERYQSNMFNFQKSKSHVRHMCVHVCHQGMCRIKVVPRSNAWWTGQDEGIDEKVSIA